MVCTSQKGRYLWSLNMQLFINFFPLSYQDILPLSLEIDLFYAPLDMAMISLLTSSFHKENVTKPYGHSAWKSRLLLLYFLQPIIIVEVGKLVKERGGERERETYTSQGYNQWIKPNHSLCVWNQKQLYKKQKNKIRKKCTMCFFI